MRRTFALIGDYCIVRSSKFAQWPPYEHLLRFAVSTQFCSRNGYDTGRNFIHTFQCVFVEEVCLGNSTSTWYITPKYFDQNQSLYSTNASMLAIFSNKYLMAYHAHVNPHACRTHATNLPVMARGFRPLIRTLTLIVPNSTRSG